MSARSPSPSGRHKMSNTTYTSPLAAHQYQPPVEHNNNMLNTNMDGNVNNGISNQSRSPHKQTNDLGNNSKRMCTFEQSYKY